MCGPSTPSTTPRIGARVDFSPAPGHNHARLPLANILFINPTCPSSSQATHVRFVHPSSLAEDNNNNNNSSLIVSIQYAPPSYPSTPLILLLTTPTAKQAT